MKKFQKENFDYIISLISPSGFKIEKKSWLSGIVTKWN